MIIVIKRGIIFLCIGLLIIMLTIAYAQSSSPSVSFEHENIKCIIIDPGHGTPDGGAVSKSGTIESTLNLQISKLLSEELTERGFKTIITREDESGLDKKKKTDMNMRLNLMKTTPADMFVSIHINTFPKSKYRGAEVLYSNNFIQSTLLAQMIMDEIKIIDPKKQTRTIKQAENSLFLMKNATIPAVIVECGFLTNPDEEQLLKTQTYQTRIASAICDGIVEYYRNIDDFEKINIVKSEEST